MPNCRVSQRDLWRREQQFADPQAKRRYARQISRGLLRASPARELPGVPRNNYLRGRRRLTQQQDLYNTYVNDCQAVLANETYGSTMANNYWFANTQGTAVTNDNLAWWDQGTQQIFQGGLYPVPTTSTSYYTPPYVRLPPRVDCQVVIPVALLDESPDPDAVLGCAYQDLEETMRQRIDTIIAERLLMNPNDVWRGWVAQITDTRWSEDQQFLRATAWATTNDPTAEIWRGWADKSNPVQGLISMTPPRKTAADLRREAQGRKRDQLITKNRRRAEYLRLKFAAKRAEALLRSVLTPEQNESLKEDRGFQVEGSAGGLYWIAIGSAGNVHRIEGGRRVENLCIHTYGHGLPDYDTMLAQLLLLQNDEARFRETANIESRAA